MKIGDVVAQHLAQGRGIEFKMSPMIDCVTAGVHSFQAINDLLREMSNMEPTCTDYYYALETRW